MATDISLQFTSDEIKNLQEAIKYYRAREGSFSSQDKLLQIVGKITNSESGTETFNAEEVTLMTKVIDENIHFMQNYEGYNFLPAESGTSRKQSIIEPLYKLRNKIKKL